MALYGWWCVYDLDGYVGHRPHRLEAKTKEEARVEMDKLISESQMENGVEIEVWIMEKVDGPYITKKKVGS